MLLWMSKAVRTQEWNSWNKVYRWTGNRDRWRAGEPEGIIEVPSDIPDEAWEVDLSWNQIEVISVNSFSGLSQCEESDLSFNKIRKEHVSL